MLHRILHHPSQDNQLEEHARRSICNPVLLPTGSTGSLSICFHTAIYWPISYRTNSWPRRIWGRLPHIVPVHEVGSTPEFPIYIVSKFIVGKDLAAHLKSATPTNHQAVQWMIDLADALREAHRKGFVHRDVKPQNILVDQDERVYLVDFGLALADQDVGKRLPAGGTPAYMSPEQARGEGHRVDGRSDLFSALALDMCVIEDRPDPVQRTLFIDEFPRWENQLKEIHDVVVSSDSPALRSGMCLAVGQIAVDKLSDGDKERWQTLASRWFVEKGDTTTHRPVGF